MNRKDFLEELYVALGKLPEGERDEAIAYYHEYLDDAGYENEEEAIASLGTVKEIAASLLAESAVKEMEDHPKSAKKGLSALWIVLLAIFATPIALPLAIGAVCILFAFLCTILGILFAFWALGLGVLFGGFGTLLLPIFAYVTEGSALALLLVIGGGIALIGLGILLSLFAFWLTKITIRGITYLFHKILRKKQGKKNPVVFPQNTEDDSIEETIEEKESVIGFEEGSNMETTEEGKGEKDYE